MADLHTTTISNEVSITDKPAVESLIDQYSWPIKPQITEDLTVYIRGACIGGALPYRETPNPENEDMDSHPDAITHPVPNGFFWRLTQFLDDPLIVKTVGNEKTRAVVGGQYRITPTRVFHRSLSDDECIAWPEPHSLTSVTVQNHETLIINDPVPIA